jgi:hypothetical protein
MTGHRTITLHCGRSQNAALTKRESKIEASWIVPSNTPDRRNPVVPLSNPAHAAIRTFSHGIFVFLLGVSLVACSGGGGGNDVGGGTAATPSPPPVTSPPAPVLTLSPRSIKGLRFLWTDVAGETEYRLLENPDGVSSYSQVASFAANATSHDHRVFLPARINARYVLQACNSVGCSDSAPVQVSGTLAAAVGYLKASNTGANDQFGFSVAIAADGNTLAVGANGEASNAVGINGDSAANSAPGSGAVYVFIRSGSTWVQQAYVKASNSDVNYQFGYSVALSADGNTLAVGSRNEASNAIGVNGNSANNSAPGSGAVFVFTRSATTWSQQAYVKASNTGPSDNFGASIALSADGNTLAAGAPQESSNAIGIDGDASDNSATNSGAVYVFTRSAGIWSQQAYVKASNSGAFDRFGWSVALAAGGNTLAVGAKIEGSNAIGVGGNQADNSASDSGAVYVFIRGASTWSQQAYLKASNTAAGAEFGVSVSLAADGNTLAVGAWCEASIATGVNGNQADSSAACSGAVYVFIRSSGIWSQQAYLKASNTGTMDVFGNTVALSADGNTLAVGAVSESSNATGINGNQADNSALASGAVYLFTRSASTWSQQAYLKASNTQEFDNFGSNIALSSDGGVLAVGAAREDSSATGIGGNQTDNSALVSGAVYLF